MIATGASWTWLATHQLQGGLSLVLWAPAALTLVLYLKSLAIKAGITRRGIYIRQLEERAEITKYTRGWESFINWVGWGRATLNN